MRSRRNLALLVAASPMTTRPIYVDGELVGVYDSASQSPPPKASRKIVKKALGKPFKIVKIPLKKTSKIVKKPPQKIKIHHRYRPSLSPESGEPSSTPLNYMRSKAISEKCITKVARRGGVKNPEPCTFDATRDTIVKKIQQVMAEVQVISHFTGNEVITAREISLAMRCIDQKFFGVPCTESGILSTLRGMKLSNCA